LSSRALRLQRWPGIQLLPRKTPLRRGFPFSASAALPRVVRSPRRVFDELVADHQHIAFKLLTNLNTTAPH
jgi:hypothetical protein